MMHWAIEDDGWPAEDHDDEAVGDEGEDEDEGHEPAVDGDNEGERAELGRSIHRVACVRRQAAARKVKVKLKVKVKKKQVIGIEMKLK